MLDFTPYPFGSLSLGKNPADVAQDLAAATSPQPLPAEILTRVESLQTR